MEHISVQDRQILRQLAQKQLAFANSPRNDEILKQWNALANGRRENPTVRLLFSNFPNEVVHPRMRCEGARARELEEMLLSTMVGRELFDDDTPISPTFDIRWKTWVHPFGTQPHITKAEGEGAMGFHIDPIIDDLAEGMDLLRGGSFGVDLPGHRGAGRGRERGLWRHPAGAQGDAQPDRHDDQPPGASDGYGELLPLHVRLPG